MARKPPPSGGPLAGWQDWGLPAFLAALSPWQDKLTHAELIPEGYQPQVGVVASLVGVLTAYGVWYACRRVKRRTLRRLCIGSLILFILAIIGCWFLVATVDVFWAPEGLAFVLTQVGWQVLYVLVNLFFSLVVATGMLLRRG